MRKLLMAAFIIACTAPFTFAQTASDDYNKVDVGVLFSHNRVDTGFDDPSQNFIDDREGFNGVNAFVKGNVSRHVGLVGDYSFHRKSFNETVGTTTVGADVDLHTLMGGVELKDNSTETKVKPFGRLLAGFQHARANFNGLTGVADESDNGFSAAVGGGIDFRVSPRVDIRAIQLEYNPTRFGGETTHNFRIGVGIIFR
ncbi:MAG TPA: outer membrane beta-barrel protein [Pyrinomonadaceae bacterium]|nr:outer membrane beta-barrel protein [Pyrinomonadaceae bacterium]